MSIGPIPNGLHANAKFYYIRNNGYSCKKQACTILSYLGGHMIFCIYSTCQYKERLGPAGTVTQNLYCHPSYQDELHRLC